MAVQARRAEWPTPAPNFYVSMFPILKNVGGILPSGGTRRNCIFPTTVRQTTEQADDSEPASLTAAECSTLPTQSFMGLLWLLSFLHSSLFGDEVLEELRMSGSTSSYDHLVKQVEALRKENSHLRRELEDNSSHLTKLETETSDMKEMLKQLQNKLEQEASNLVPTGRSDILDQLTELNTDIASLCDNKWQSNMVCTGPGRFTLDQTFERNQAHPTTPLAQDYVPRPHGRLEHLEELNEERALLLSEIEKEEKEKAFYCAQIQNLGKRADEMLQIRSVSKHMDLIRQQLQYEAHQIKAIIEERYGTGDSTTERLQMRMNRVQEIEKEILQSQQRVRETETEVRFIDFASVNGDH
ncbi:adenomatous polyposis coli protein 2-like [Leucoraja erinacea]|uniref:adenomatous polyposis coli protein 2-like n=1 Tax=Leucoraja erinaceus TaxID=7782 RepID=UPI0024578DD8|nr:adenomatous polyposis coli protein 2-like [Leucoraja erinacea]